MIEDASIECTSYCKFVEAEYLEPSWQMWTFQTPDGKNISVFSSDAIEAIDHYAVGNS